MLVLESIQKRLDLITKLYLPNNTSPLTEVSLGQEPPEDLLEVIGECSQVIRQESLLERSLAMVGINGHINLILFRDPSQSKHTKQVRRV